MKDSNQYPARRVIRASFKAKSKRYKYYVEWKERKKGKYVCSFEPLEHLISCPLLVLEYEESLYKKLKDAAGDGIGPTFSRKEPIDDAIKAVVGPPEYMPEGHEIVSHIKHSMSSSIDDEIVELFVVKFEGSREWKIIRRSVMEYFFPVDLLIFWKREQQSAVL